MDISVVVAVLGAALATATFFAGRQTAAKSSGQEWGRLLGDVEHIKASVDAMGRRWDSDTKTLRKEIMQEEAERKESVRRLHVRIDEHIEKYHVEDK